MTFQALAERLGVKDYPEVLNTYYPLPAGRENEFCSMDLICRLQEKFDLFGKYFDLVKQGWQEISQENGDRKAFIDAMSLCIRDLDCKSCRRMKYPKTDGTVAGNMLPLYGLLPSVEDAYKEYVTRGFTHEQALVNLEGFKINLEVVENHILGVPGFTDLYANWCVLYIKCKIFYHHGLNFEIHTSPSYNAFVLKNKKSGALLPVFGNEISIHKSGIPLGSNGAEEEEGSFIARFEETKTEYVGNPSRNILVEQKRERFSKEEWELVYQPGDHDLSVHIPRNTDFSPEAVSRSLTEALELTKRCYPEWEPKAFYCCSWLLSPILQDILGTESKISSFALRYTRYPRKSEGKSPMSYVYPLGVKSYEELPENTSLQRGLKKVYLNGDFVYDTSGVILIEK
ncbi:MAG: hypothetical protein IKD18_04135 [Clostridia bacterium]|nr:hypothetical protein [Clostridia bacterium]